MRCMKCGREIPEQQVFCRDCLEDMKNHPVKANVTVQLPPRTEAPVVKKKPRRYRDAKPEELLRHQKLLIRCLCAALAVSVAAVVLLAGMLLELLNKQEADFNIGQNYGTVTDSNPN